MLATSASILWSATEFQNHTGTKPSHFTQTLNIVLVVSATLFCSSLCIQLVALTCGQSNSLSYLLLYLSLPAGLQSSSLDKRPDYNSSSHFRSKLSHVQWAIPLNELRSFRPNLKSFRLNSKSFRLNSKSFRPNLKSFRLNSKSFRPNLKLFRPDQNKTSTVETLFTLQVKAVGGLLSSANDQRTLFDFVTIGVQQSYS